MSNMTNKKTKADYFIPENADLENSKDLLSPSGKYRLLITPYSTAPSGWGYTQGLVYNVATGKLIAEVQQNYSSFPFLWVEGHASGHNFLICHENYQGQTVIELDTELRKDFLPEAAAKGHGFCWAEYTHSTTQKLLVVEGCYWGGSYEFKFYDFSDPMNAGWPELDAGENYFDSIDDAKKPDVRADGHIVYYESRRVEDEDGEPIYDENDNTKTYVVATKTLKREGPSLILTDEWIDPEEINRREEWRIRQEKYETSMDLYRATDPIYLFVMNSIPENGFDAGHVSIGQCYEGWCPHFTEKDARVCYRLANFRVVNGNKITIDIDWGKEKAPIRLQVHVDQVSTVYWFTREQMPEALALAKLKLTGKPGILETVKNFVLNAIN